MRLLRAVLAPLLGLRRWRLCSRWGCVLMVGEGSQWGPGPTCEVCVYHLRATAFPPLDLGEGIESCEEVSSPNYLPDPDLDGPHGDDPIDQGELP